MSAVFALLETGIESIAGMLGTIRFCFTSSRSICAPQVPAWVHRPIDRALDMRDFRGFTEQAFAFGIIAGSPRTSNENKMKMVNGFMGASRVRLSLEESVGLRGEKGET